MLFGDKRNLTCNVFFFFFPKQICPHILSFFLTELRVVLVFTSMAGSGPPLNDWLAGWMAPWITLIYHMCFTLKWTEPHRVV
jgi:hypothetical protein